MHSPFKCLIIAPVIFTPIAETKSSLKFGNCFFFVIHASVAQIKANSFRGEKSILNNPFGSGFIIHELHSPRLASLTALSGLFEL